MITLILSLGFGQLLRFEFLGVPLYLHDIIILVFLAIQVTILVKNYKDRNFVIPVAIKIFLIGLSLGWLYALFLFPISYLLIPSLYTLRLLAYLALYFVIKKSNIKIPLIYFLIGGMVQWFIGLIQYFMLPDMRVFQYLGWDDHLNRLTLPHFDPTFTAVMLGLALLSNIRLTRFWFLTSIFYSAAILLSYSRSVWLSLALTFTYFMLKNKKLNFLIIGICLLVIPILFLPKKFGEGTNLLRTYSISSRLTSDLMVAKQSGWNLVVGQGMNTFPRNSINNSYLYLLATTGVMGLTGWLMLMYSLYQKSTHKPMLIFFFIASLFNNVMFYPFALLWVLLIEATVPTSA